MFDSVFLNTLILLGALQGIILAVLVRHAKGSRYLTWFVFLIAWCCMNLFLQHQRWYTRSDIGGLVDALVPFIVAMAMGPLLYAYIRSVLYPARKPVSPWLFAPVILDLVPIATGWIFVIGRLTGLVSQSQGPKMGLFIDDWNMFVDIPRWISMGIYLVLSIRMYRAWQSAQVGLNPAHQEKAPLVQWVKQLLWVFSGFQVIWLIHLVPYILPFTSNKLLNWADWYPLYLPLVLIIYWIGIKIYQLALAPPVTPRALIKPKTPTLLDPEWVLHSKTMILKTMEVDKLYLDPELSLSKLAAQVGLPPKTVSTILNQEMETSFGELVNGYRIRAVQQLLLDPSKRDMTITGLAYDCGFNSQPTFQRAFKAQTGLTPKEFIQQSTVKSGIE
jgi:AraC-like DNA-binding protein